MRIQRIIWLSGRIMFYLSLFLLLLVVTFSLAKEHWWTSLAAMVILVLTIYRGLIRLKVPANSVIVRDGKVVFYIPRTTIRNRFDFVTRGQSIVELPEYQVLDRPFKMEIFFPGSEVTVHSCRLSLRLFYLMQPAAWQKAYDCFVEYHERMPMAVRKLLLKSGDGMVLRPPAITGEDAVRRFLTPIVSALNLELGSIGLEVVDVRCSFTAGSSLARLVASEQEILDKGVTEEVFRWLIRADEEEPHKGGWALLGVSGKNEL
jgi:hypothetical protein